MQAHGDAVVHVDAVVVGAGFAGMYMLHRLREGGLSVRAFEAGDDVGGTWYWNRYPGARCDVESTEYQYGFSDEIAQGWNWSERYAAQPEIMRYADYVATRLNLRDDIQFKTRVTAAAYDGAARRWTVETDQGDTVSAQFCIMATGCLSASRVPEIAGRHSFTGKSYHTGAWPHEGVDFTGQRVAVIGTGSSGVQSIPLIAAQAERLWVFQRTPNFSLPALNRPLPPEVVQRAKSTFMEERKRVRATNSGAMMAANPQSALDVAEAERRRNFELRWEKGGFAFVTAYNDMLTNIDANSLAAEFVREKIRQIVKDPKTAALLAPTNHPIGTKRLCLDTDYYETYNLPHVTLVDIADQPIERITAEGPVVGGEQYSVDSIVFATGFDAMTGALLRIDVRGRGGLSLRDKWAAGPRTYLGLGIAGFPQSVHHHRARQPVGTRKCDHRHRTACRLDHGLHRPYAGRGPLRDRGGDRRGGSVGRACQRKGRRDALSACQLLVCRRQRARQAPCLHALCRRFRELRPHHRGGRRRRISRIPPRVSLDSGGPAE